MGKAWDGTGIAFCVDTWKEVYRVMKPGANLLAFGGTRTYHRMVVAIEEAGFDVIDSVHWLHGQGFPKSKHQLKPAHEPIVLATKPGGAKWLGIEQCRIGTETTTTKVCEQRFSGQDYANGQVYKPKFVGEYENPPGRWPSNVCLSHIGGPDGCVEVGVRRVKAGNSVATTSVPGMFGVGTRIGRHYADPDGRETVAEWRCVEQCPIRQLDMQAGERKGDPPNRKPRRAVGFGSDFMDDNWNPGAGVTTSGFTDSGNVSRFFYCSKASKADRGEGNRHPTVKSTPLMRWLCRLVTPPGGIILDPFMGSGSTGKAAVLEGFGFVGIEQEAESFATAQRRIKAAQAKEPLFS